MKKRNKKMSNLQVFFMLILTAGLLIWALPRFYRNDFPTPPCVTSVWNEGQIDERVDTICVMGEGK